MKIVRIEKTKDFLRLNSKESSMDVETTKDASKNVGRIQYKPVEEDWHPC